MVQEQENQQVQDFGEVLYNQETPEDWGYGVEFTLKTLGIVYRNIHIVRQTLDQIFIFREINSFRFEKLNNLYTFSVEYVVNDEGEFNYLQLCEPKCNKNIAKHFL